jgi:hypothetical protein
MRTFALEDILAPRTLRFEPGHRPAIDITVTLGRPLVDPEHAERAWMCPFQITGIGDERVRAIFGIDALQALLLALHILPAQLRALARDESGSFRQFPNAIPCVFNQNQRAGFQIRGAFLENRVEPLIYRRWPFVSQPEDDHARFVEHPEREDVTEIEIEREDDARVDAGALDNLGVRCSLHGERSDVHGLMTEVYQKLDGQG